MKKFMTFAIMALLLGGFAFTANAQKPKKENDSKEVKDPKAKGEDWDKVLKEYELAVEQCVNLFKAGQSKEQSTKYDPKEFEKCLNKAEDLKSQLENVKDQLNRTQVNRFNKATKKLSEVYQKS